MQLFIRVLMIFVGISGCFSVLFGAWLAHAGQMLAENVQTSLATAVQYQFLHTLALFGCVILAKVNAPSKLLSGAAIAFISGIMLFSGTIYIKSLFDVRLIGSLTPAGGILFALAWLLLAFEGKKQL